MRFREVREIKTVEKKKVIPSQYLINELNRYFDEIDNTEDIVLSKLDMIKSTSPEQLDEILHENLKGE